MEGCRLLLEMKEGELAGLGEVIRTCLALVAEWGGLLFELLGDFRLELGDFPGAIDASVEDVRDVNAEEEGGDLNLAGGALLGEEEGLRKRAGTFLFLFPRSKFVWRNVSINTIGVEMRKTGEKKRRRDVEE